MFGWSVAIFGKTMFVRAAWKNNDNGLDEGAVYVFMPQGETWIDNTNLTASDGA